MKPLKPRTIKSRLYRLRQIVSALVLKGWDIEKIVSLSQIVEIGRGEDGAPVLPAPRRW